MHRVLKGLPPWLAPVCFSVGILVLPACSLVNDPRRLTSECDQFTGSVRVSTVAGTQTLTTDDAAFSSGQYLEGCSPTLGGTAADREADALARWESFVTARLPEICTSEPGTDLARRLCPGPWCYAEPPSVGDRRALPPDPAGSSFPRVTTPPSPLPSCAPTADVDVPTDVPFGDVPVQQPSPTPSGPVLSFDVRNRASGLVRIRAVVLDRAFGNPDDFAIGGDCVPTLDAERREGVVLIGDGGRPSCRVDVTFSPADPGPRAGRLHVEGIDGTSYAQVGLSGTGLPGLVSLMPSGFVTFAGVACDADGYRRVSVTLVDAGPGDVRVDGVGPSESTAAGNWFRIEDAVAPFWLPPSSRALTVRACRAGGEGAAITTLRVQSNGEPRTFEVEIRPAAFACPVVPATCP